MEFLVFSGFGEWVASCMCTKVHSSCYLMLGRADRSWRYSQRCGDKFVCLWNCVRRRRRAYLCVFCRVSVYECVFVRVVIPLRNQTASTFVVLTGPEGPAPIMQRSHYSVSGSKVKPRCLTLSLLSFQYVGSPHTFIVIYSSRAAERGRATL